MKQNFRAILLSLLAMSISLPTITACAGNGTSGKPVTEKADKPATGVKPITGTWINLAYKDVRNKYTNPQNFDNTDPKLWEAKVRHKKISHFPGTVDRTNRKITSLITAVK